MKDPNQQPCIGLYLDLVAAVASLEEALVRLNYAHGRVVGPSVCGDTFADVTRTRVATSIELADHLLKKVTATAAASLELCEHQYLTLAPASPLIM